MFEIFELIYQMIYILLLVILFVDFAVAKIMDWLNIGEAPFLSPVIGTAAGWLVLWMSPTTIAGVIVGAVVTVIVNLTLTYAIYPKLADKADEVGEKLEAKHEAKDAQYILDAISKEERVKYLARHSSHGQYVFEVNATPENAYEVMINAFDENTVRSIHPQVTMIKGVNDDNNQIVRFECPRFTVAFVVKSKNSVTYANIMLVDVDETGLKLKERVALDKERNDVYDSIYCVIRNALNNLYTSCGFSMIHDTYKSAQTGNNASSNIDANNPDAAYPEKRAALSDLPEGEDIWTCPECGWINSAGQDECIGCGHSSSPDFTIPLTLTQPTALTQPATMLPPEKRVIKMKRCSKCKTPATGKFCKRCGTEINK